MNIVSQSFPARSYLFAKISSLTYKNLEETKAEFESLGFQSEFVEANGSQMYFLFNDTDIILAFRGTEPTQFEDIEADIDAVLVTTIYTPGRVHRGFNRSVNNLWDEIVSKIRRLYKEQDIFCTGHSLGAAMALIVGHRLSLSSDLPSPLEVFTYGCPRVGDKSFVSSLTLMHHRWVNNADIVTRVPSWPARPHGNLWYMNHWGNVRKLSYLQIVKDRIRGFFRGLQEKQINFFVNHSISRYQVNLENYKDGVEVAQNKI